MLIVNGRPFPEPQSYRYDPPDVVSTALTGEPVLSWQMRLRLRYPLPCDADLVRDWYELQGQEVQLSAPFFTGCTANFVGYVVGIGADVEKDGVAKGIDVELLVREVTG